MTDALGFRRKFAVLVPSTNTVVQPEFHAMRPEGVTNHISRIRIPNMPLASDADFRLLVERIAAAQLEAVDSALSCEPDHVVLGISVETFWGGLAAQMEAERARPVLAINACIYWHALRANGIADRIAGWGGLLQHH
jgi:maleate isomerase